LGTSLISTLLLMPFYELGSQSLTTLFCSDLTETKETLLTHLGLHLHKLSINQICQNLGENHNHFLQAICLHKCYTEGKDVQY
jgi:hypothetical protein